MSSKPKNIKLWEDIKQEIKDKYKKRWNAYYSGMLVKEYKQRGGEFIGRKRENAPLKRWFKEEWKDIGNKEYPVYRPTKRITKETPLTINEIDKENLKKQIKIKQRIKGSSNLPRFKSRNQ